jgi:polynucleotide 5'-hydroxyl-kinase GRC3/NOL9
MSLPSLAWSDAVERVAREAGVVMVVGATDAGKTTFTLSAANLAVRDERRAAILDTDLGQSEVGPPGTLGLVRLEQPVATLSEVRPRALAFVGDTAPVGHLLSLLQGAHRLVRHARERGDELVLVDTSGFVQGRLAEKLKLAKLAVLDPSLVIVLHQGSELERLAELMAGASRAEVIYVQRHPEARRKSTVYRRVQRANRMRSHLEKARLQDLDAGQVRAVDAWLFTGKPLTARQLQFVSRALKVDVPHGEVTPDGVFLCAAGRPDRKGFRRASGRVRQEAGDRHSRRIVPQSARRTRG